MMESGKSLLWRWNKMYDNPSLPYRCPISGCMSVYTKASHDKDVESAETILNALKGRNN